MKRLQKYLLIGASILTSNFAFGQSEGDTLQLHKDSYGVWIDHCVFSGLYSETDSVFIKLGSTEGANNIKEYKDLLKFGHTTSGIEGAPDVKTDSYVFRAFLSGKDLLDATKYVTITIRRNGVALKQQTYSLL